VTEKKHFLTVRGAGRLISAQNRQMQLDLGGVSLDDPQSGSSYPRSTMASSKRRRSWAGLRTCSTPTSIPLDGELPEDNFVGEMVGGRLHREVDFQIDVKDLLGDERRRYHQDLQSEGRRDGLEHRFRHCENHMGSARLATCNSLSAAACHWSTSFADGRLKVWGSSWARLSIEFE
jgi:hypothetical protein